MAPLSKKARNYSRTTLIGYINKFDNVSGFLWGIFVKDTGLHIGWRRIYYDPELGTAVNDVAIGDKAYRGRGVGKEIQGMAQGFMFYSVGAKWMVARVYGDNTPSRRLTEGLGFRVSRREPEQVLGTDGVLHEVIWYELSERDWRAQRKWIHSPVWRAGC